MGCVAECSESVDSVSGRKEGRGMKHTMMN